MRKEDRIKELWTELDHLNKWFKEVAHNATYTERLAKYIQKRAVKITLNFLCK